MRGLRLVRAALFLAALTVVSDALAQGGLSFADVLKGGSLPTKMKIADLPPDFKAARLTIVGDAGSNPMSGLGGLMGMLMPMMALGKSGAGAPANDQKMLDVMGMLDVTWVRPDGVTIDGQKFLVTYKLSGWTLATLDKMKPDQLSLQLQLVRADSISAVSPMPDLTKEEFGKALQVPAIGEQMPGVPGGEVTEGAVAPTMPVQPTREMVATELERLRGLAVATMLYAQDNNDKLPAVQDTATAIKMIQPYVKDPEAAKTLNPNGGRLLFNMGLSGKKLSSIEFPAEIPLFYDSKEWPDGMRGVAYADGHVKFLRVGEWQRIQQYLKPKK